MEPIANPHFGHAYPCSCAVLAYPRYLRIEVIDDQHNVLGDECRTFKPIGCKRPTFWNWLFRREVPE
jgi:hypothetical protein